MVPFSTAGLATGQDTVLCSTFCFLSAPPRSGAAVGWISEWMGAHHPADCAGRLVVLLEHPQDLLLPQRGEARLVLPVEEQSDQAVPLHKVHRRRRVTRLETDHGGLDLKGQVLRAGQGALPADGCALPAEETCVCLSPDRSRSVLPKAPNTCPTQQPPSNGAYLRRWAKVRAADLHQVVGFRKQLGVHTQPAQQQQQQQQHLSRWMHPGLACHALPPTFSLPPLQTTPCWRWQPRRQYGGEAGAAAWRGSSMAAGRRVAGRPAVHVRALLSAEPLRELELEHDHLWATAVSSVIQLQPAGAAHSWRGAADGPRSGTSGGGPGA